jgi:hypothetical protein
MVRADGLEPDAIINALRRGDFYASTGITLEDYTVAPGAIAVKIRQSTRLNGWTPDARFLTRFIGEGGRVLAEVAGLEPKYVFRGNEIYVRAAITDSNGRRAWTQPVFRASGGSRP